MDRKNKLYLLLGLYVGSLYASNLLGGKLMPIGFGDRGLTVSIVMLPFLFLITDIVGEVYGKKEAKRFVNVGLITLAVLFVWQLFCTWVPGAVPSPWYNEYNAAYGTIFNLSLTFTIASLIAYMLGQHIDVHVYHMVLKAFGKKRMWLRNNVSTAVGQFVDASMWTYIAFAPLLFDGTYNVITLFSIVVLPYWFSRFLLGILHTPLCYVGVRWLRGGKKKVKGRNEAEGESQMEGAPKAKRKKKKGK
jgi:queuosine precursor transporter